MVVLNSRDRHKKHGIPLLCASITRLTIYPIRKISLCTVVLNSRDRNKKTWHPTFAHLHNTPHNILYLKKLTKMHR